VSIRNWRHQAVVGIGFVLSAIFLWLSLRQVDGKSLGDAFATINYSPVLLCAGTLLLGIMLQTVRWRVFTDFPTLEYHSLPKTFA